MSRVLFNARRRGAWLVADQYTRGAGLPVGNTDSNGERAPSAPTDQAHTWGMSSVQSTVDTSAGGSIGIETYDLGFADIDFSATLNISGNALSTGGICFRFSDTSNFWHLQRVAGGGQYRLCKRVAGVDTQIGVDTTSTDIRGRVITKANQIDTYMGSTLLFSTSDAFNSTATKHGFIVFNTNATNAFDDLLFYRN